MLTPHRISDSFDSGLFIETIMGRSMTRLSHGTKRLLLICGTVFDYLRQSLACAADSTLEPVISELGGVTGWGFSRGCRNYGELKRWAEKRRVNHLQGFLELHHEH